MSHIWVVEILTDKCWSACYRDAQRTRKVARSIARLYRRQDHTLKTRVKKYRAGY